MNRLLLLSLALLSATGTAIAARVTPSQASAYAAAYLRNIIKTDAKPATVAPIVFGEASPLYVVNLVPQGWVIIAADDVIAPVVGYSESGFIRADSIDPNFKAYLGHFADDVAVRSERGDDSSPAWATDTIASTNKAASAVAPLVKVEWNQSGKYRQYCPSSSSAGDAIVGCVAVGMGQAMAVYRKPARPRGFKQYKSENYGVLSVDYDSEAPYNWSEIINAQSSESDGKECARLLYHLGVSVEMSYSGNGSGVTYMGVVPYALKTYFGYSNKVTNVGKDKYSDAEWSALLKNELSAGRPLIYAGYSTSGGHCFNIDGYNEAGLFHFNFGWGGNGNGYFAISAHEYNSGERCAINFAPATGEPSAIVLSNSSVAKGSPTGSVVATLSAETDMDGCQFIFATSGVENPVTGVVSEPAFSVDGDKLVTNDVFAEKYGADSKAKVTSVNITATNVETLATLTQKVSITLSASAALSATAEEGASVIVSDGAVVITTLGEAICATLVSTDGKTLGRASIAPYGSHSFASLPRGLYALTLSRGGNSSTRLIIVK